MWCASIVVISPSILHPCRSLQITFQTITFCFFFLNLVIDPIIFYFIFIYLNFNLRFYNNFHYFTNYFINYFLSFYYFSANRLQHIQVNISFEKYLSKTFMRWTPSQLWYCWPLESLVLSRGQKSSSYTWGRARLFFFG